MAAPARLTTETDGGKPISILSIDAGGPQGISQLLILNNVMHSLSKDENGIPQGEVKRPCEVFDVIGGVGTGGLIAIFLVNFKMTAKEALDQYTDFAVEVFKDVNRGPKEQTKKLERAIGGIIERHGVDREAKLISAGQPAPRCKLLIPIMYKNNVGLPCVLRNYTASHEPPVDITIAEAMLATCATPPIFMPTSISKDFAIFEYVAGDLSLSNPIREILSDAHRTFGDERPVSCVLSIGSGHPGVTTVPNDPGGSGWIDLLERLAMDGEKTAREFGAHTSHLSLYHRLSVKYGLEKERARERKDPNVIAGHTTNYLNDLDVVGLVNYCVETIKHGDGFATLERLTRYGGNLLPPPLPPLTPSYVERKVPMEFIEKAVFEEDGSIREGSKRIIVTGIGGCGKTQLIRKFIGKHKRLFVSTFFIDGSGSDTIRRDIVRNVRALGGVRSQDSFEESMRFLSQASQDSQRLFVVDNVDDPAVDLTPFLPRWLNGVLIVTSRDHSRGRLNPAAHLQLDVMTLEESVELLIRGSGQTWPPTVSVRQEAILAKELAFHPIALAQAISYMYNTGCSTEIYVSLLSSHRDRLLRDHPATSEVDLRYKTAFAAFDASYNLLPPKARNLWHLLSFYRPQRFPLGLVALAAEDAFSTDWFSYLSRGKDFELGRDCLKEIFYHSDQWDPLELHSILATLRSHSLITTISVENVTLLQMHPLVHEWGRLCISEGEVPRFEAAAVRLLCCGAKEDNYSMMQYLFSHIDALYPAWERLHPNDATSMSFILLNSGMYDKAATLQVISHETIERKLGAEHANTVTSSANLAAAYHTLGRYAEAEKLEAEVLKQRKRLLGVEHPDTIQASANLAATFQVLGRYVEAEELKAEVLRQRKRLLGVEHPDTIHASANLATTFHALGRYAEVEELEIEVLRQRKRLLGVEHPDTIHASANLATTFHVLGRYAEAEELETEVLRQRKRLLGVEHPDAIQASANLATTFHVLGRYAEAEELETEVLRQRKRLLGVEHPDTIQASASLAATFRVLGRYAEAEELDTEVLRQRKRLLGVEHPDTIHASANLAATYHSLGRYVEAEKLETEVLRQRKRLLGVEHPDAIHASANLAATFRVLGRYVEAEELNAEVLRQRKRLLGVEHPDTIHASANLAATFRVLGRYADAEELDTEVLRQRKRLLGVEHPDTIHASANLAATFRVLGRYADAEELDTEVLRQRKRLLGVEHPDTIQASANLATTYHSLGRYAEAGKLETEVLKQRKRLLGVEHPDTIHAYANLASTFHVLGRHAEAEELKTEVLRQRKRLLGVEHPDTIHASANLANTFRALGRYAEAEELDTEVLRQRKRLLGVEHPDTIQASANLAATFRVLGRYAEAEELETEVLRQRKRLLGVEHPDTIHASANLAATFRVLGRYAEAEELNAEALKQRKRLLGVEHPDTIQASASLAATFHALGRYAEAEELETEVLRQRTRLLGVDHPDTIHASANLADTFRVLGCYAEAEELETEVLRIRTALLSERHPDTIRSMLHLAQTYRLTNRHHDASSLARRSLQIASETIRDAHPLYQEIRAFLAPLPHEEPARPRRRGRFVPYVKRAPRK